MNIHIYLYSRYWFWIHCGVARYIFMHSEVASYPQWSGVIHMYRDVCIHCEVARYMSGYVYPSTLQCLHIHSGVTWSFCADFPICNGEIGAYIFKQDLNPVVSHIHSEVARYMSGCIYPSTLKWFHVHMSHITTVVSHMQLLWVMSYIWMSHILHMRESCHTNPQVKSHISRNRLPPKFHHLLRQWNKWLSMGRRRLIGCLKLQVIFRKRATNHRALLRKIIYEDKASHDSTPPCTIVRGTND